MPIDSSPIIVDAHLDTRDLFWIYFTNSTQRAWYTRMYLALVFIALIALVPDYFGAFKTLLLPPFIYVISAAAVYYTLVQPYLKARHAAKGLSAGTTQRYTFSESGIDVATQHMTAHYKWSAFRMAKQTHSLIILYTAGTFGLVLPKRCFPSEQQLTAVRKLLTEKIKKKHNPGSNVSQPKK